MKKIVQLFQYFGRWVGRIMSILIFLFLFPFLLPDYIKKKKFSKSFALFLFYPNAFVFFLIYSFFLHVILLKLGYTDADVFKWIAPLSNDPAEHFGPFFFTFFFPLIGFYVYINHTEQWDMKAIRREFAEYIPTKKEIHHAIIDKYERIKKWKRLLGFFRKYFLWTFILIFTFFIFANFESGRVTQWTNIFLPSLLFALVLSLVFTMGAEEKYQKQKKITDTSKK